VNPLPTRDPFTGDELVVTRLECPATGTAIEGQFSLGWLGRLTIEQIEFVGLLLRHRNNLQRVAQLLGVAYNTARSRLDDIVTALDGEPQPVSNSRIRILERLAAGEITTQDANDQLRRL
jgi:hypothetical protein